MKTKILMAAILLLLGNYTSKAQGLSGLFGQQAKKRKIMIAQIAALAVYDRQQVAGYQIDDNGLKEAYAHKDDEFAAHTAYYQSLEEINQSTGADGKKKQLLKLQAQVNQVFSSEVSWQENHRELRRDELVYLKKVADGMREKCATDITEMQGLTSRGKLRMTDAERLERLDKLVSAMKDKYAFALSFTGKCRKLATARAGQRKDQDNLKKLYGH
ncbi:hypothetical protein [Mucilaginibacter terrae]|uniref:DUF5045 domain-containing protein n=1 Tax=Mucilaginibacter terrae TaxID=1955052 RepID=A0ABU3GS70_9SPHI|nr:hypothetical protein [Mucilaginibacter terrae]MDT3402321.1 hypothetical protein [Mucilaginibacter terrae]